MSSVYGSVSSKASFVVSIHYCYYHNISEAMAFSWLKLTLACMIYAKCAISGAGAAAVKIVSFPELLYT